MSIDTINATDKPDYKNQNFRSRKGESEFCDLQNARAEHGGDRKVERKFGGYRSGKSEQERAHYRRARTRGSREDRGESAGIRDQKRRQYVI